MNKEQPSSCSYGVWLGREGEGGTQKEFHLRVINEVLKYYGQGRRRDQHFLLCSGHQML